MIKQKNITRIVISFFTSVTIAISLTACSQATKFGSQNKTIEEDSALVIPPSLKMPSGVATTARTPTPSSRKTNTQLTRKTTSQPRQRQAKHSPHAKNYYVVVGTYPSQEEALDTFVRLSSIGLPNSTMETRMTKTGKRLHMVRLGPFQDQTKIDKVKDSLLSDGLSQFKVVEN